MVTWAETKPENVAVLDDENIACGFRRGCSGEGLEPNAVNMNAAILRLEQQIAAIPPPIHPTPPPVLTVEGEDGSAVFKMDGVEFGRLNAFFSDNMIDTPASAMIDIAAGYLGVVTGSEAFQSFNIPSCGGSLNLTTISSIQQDVAGPDGSPFARVVYRPYANVDGGPWSPYTTGGQDVYYRSGAQDNISESSFTDKQTFNGLAGGNHTFGHRLSVELNTIAFGTVFSFPQLTTHSHVTRMNVC